MNINKQFYFLGFGFYVFSFFLPAVSVLNKPLYGYYCAFFVFGSLFSFNGILDFTSTVFLNLANIFTLFVFIMQFKKPFKKLLIFQVIALFSALYWIVNDLAHGDEISNYLIGYWDWVFGILYMLIAMLASMKAEKNMASNRQRAYG